MKAVRTLILVCSVFAFLAVAVGSASAYTALTPRNTDSKTAPTCGDQKPPTPLLYYSEKVSNNQVKLVWDGVSPANSWTVAYGPGSGQYVWGYNNFGDSNTRSVTINDLPNGTYYFVVRANNGCMPGPFSNEVSMSLGYVATGTYQAPTTTTTATTPKATPTVVAPKQPTTPKTTTPQTTTPKTTTSPGSTETMDMGTGAGGTETTPTTPTQPAQQPGFFQRIINFFLGLFGQ